MLKTATPSQHCFSRIEVIVKQGAEYVLDSNFSTVTTQLAADVSDPASGDLPPLQDRPSATIIINNHDNIILYIMILLPNFTQTCWETLRHQNKKFE